MSKKMNRRDFLKGTALTALGLAAAGVGTGALAEEKAGYIPGTYSATVKGMNDVTVTATFSESAITEVTVDTSAETAGIGKELGNAFAAQIMERQSAEVDAVGGATLTTNAVREALTQCIAQAKGVDLSAAAGEKESNVSTDPKFWLGDAPVIPEDAIAETFDTELLVIGSGHSGLMCARKAAELGTKVMVMEKMSEAVWSPIGCDMAAVNADYYLEQGCKPVDEMEVLNEWQRRSMNRSNPALIRQFATRSGECANWIRALAPKEELDEFSVYCNFPDGRVSEAMTISGRTSFAGSVSYRDFNNKLGNGDNQPALKPIWMYSVKKAQEEGVRWLWGTRGIVLCQNEAGDVTGAIGQREDGSYVKVNASKAVVLACGDFSGNGAMVYALMDEIRNLITTRHIELDDTAKLNGMSQDGSGIKMGLWAGGMMEAGPRAAMNFGVGGSVGASLGIVGDYPQFGPDGKRFFNESIVQFGGHGLTARKRLGGLYCSIADGKILDGMKVQSYEHNMSSTTCEREWSLVEEDIRNYKTGPEGFQVHGFTGYGMNTSTVYAAETLDELADILGYEGEAKQGLLDEIAHYNEMCAAGKDTDWGRDPQHMIPIDTPPFFGNSAVAGESARIAGGMVQLSGLQTDDNQQVRRQKDDSLIKGLFATGNCCGDRYSVQYHTTMIGNTVGMACTLGMCLGEYIAKNL